MFSRPLAAGLLAVTCVSAAGAGAYLAVRHNDGADPASAVSAADAAAVAPEPTPRPAALSTPAGPFPLENSRPVAARPAGSGTELDRTARVRRPAETRARRDSAPAEPLPVRATSPRTAEPAVAASPAADGPPAPAGIDPAPAAAMELPKPEPPAPPAAAEFDEVVVPEASVVGLQISTHVSTERARLEDRVEARVTRDVVVDGRTAIPAGTRAIGAVTLVERGGKVKERARLGVRFHTLVLADGTELPVRTEAILREGQSPTGDSSRKIGGAAIGGAILGGLLGGKKGAIVGGATGAAGGTAAVMAGSRSEATLPVGAVVTVRLTAPLPVTVERQ